MATTGPRIYPGASTFPGSSLYAGQGLLPRIQALYSTEPVASPPDWQHVPEGNIRSWTVTRGRDSELAEIDAGTASVVIDNTDRTFDPTEHAEIRPLNRWWLRVQFDGATEDVFVGYAESYDQQWPGKGADAVTVVSLVDEFKVLALEALPTTDPPRDNYHGVVMYDAPHSYWPMDKPLGADTLEVPALAGTPLIGVNGQSSTTIGAIVGDETAMYQTIGIPDFSTSYLRTQQIESGAFASGDFSGLSSFTIEFWMAPGNVTPAATVPLIDGPSSGGTWTYNIYFTTGGVLTFDVKNGTGTNHQLTYSGILDDEPGFTWRHFVLVADANASLLRLYVNGSQHSTVAWSGSIGAVDASQDMRIGPVGASADTWWFDEVALYRAVLSADRIAAHYEAGVSRGFQAGETGVRVGDVLDVATSIAPRRLHLGVRLVGGTYMKGQAPLEVLREAVQTEAVDAMLYVGRDGAIVFLDAAHRSESHWINTQAIFDDDGTDIPYFDIDVDYSEAFLFNEWNVTPRGHPTWTASDATSIARYFKRTRALPELNVIPNAAAEDIAPDMLAKYKDPHFRITRLVLAANRPEIAEVVFGIELGDMIQVSRTPPGGGDRIEQSLYIQKIDISADPGEWVVTWGVSPL